MLAELSRVEVAERMTADAFFELAPAEKAELINGVMIMPPPPLDVHERENVFLLRLISEYVERLDIGEVRGSRTAVRLSDMHVFEPDVLFVARERVNIIEERGVFGPPDLVVEMMNKAGCMLSRCLIFVCRWPGYGHGSDLLPFAMR